MKLIIKTYLSSLKERDQLDVLLPNLVSQMGLELLSTPIKGGRQYGVDFAAVGSAGKSKEKKLYLFTIKKGDIERDDWNNDKSQSLRPSLDEIKDVYIQNNIPNEHKNKHIVICIAFGGEIKQSVEQNISGYEHKNSSDNITFERWNGDKIAELIEHYYLNENLVSNELKLDFRKALSMADIPDASYRFFKKTVEHICNTLSKNKKINTAIMQVYLCLSVLYSYSQDFDNIESAYLSSELSLLRFWDIVKNTDPSKNITIPTVFIALLELYLEISSHYVQKISRHSHNLYAISASVSTYSKEDINVKLFDILGRVAICGIFMKYKYDNEKNEGWKKQYDKGKTICEDILHELIRNNPLLYTPYLDEQIIDITLAAYFLFFEHKNWNSVKYWLNEMAHRIYQFQAATMPYPSPARSYEELLKKTENSEQDQNKNIIPPFVIYPYIAALAVLFNAKDTYEVTQKTQSKYLKNKNLQIYFINEDSEANFYTNKSPHGSSLIKIDLPQDPLEYMKNLSKECNSSNQFYDLSAFKEGFWPLILLACRHYRLPIPIHFIVDLYKQLYQNNTENTMEEGV